jgi:rhodanese-related sulfurtransferase
MDLKSDQVSINDLKKSILSNKYLIPLAIFAAVLVSGVGTLSIIAYQHQMSLPVYWQSFSTPQISAEALASGKFKSVILIDVRSPDEYQEDHISNSELVPLPEIESMVGVEQVKNIVERYQQKHQSMPTVVLYCTSGMRSIKANKYLRDRGYQTLTLTGGITAWRKQFTRSQDLQILSAK